MWRQNANFRNVYFRRGHIQGYIFNSNCLNRNKRHETGIVLDQVEIMRTIAWYEWTKAWVSSQTHSVDAIKVPTSITLLVTMYRDI